MADLATLPAIVAQALPGPLGNVGRWGQTLLAQPALRRALPLVLMLLVVAALAIGWLLLRAPDYRPLYPQLAEADKAAVAAALTAGNFHSRINSTTGVIEIAEGEAAAARIMLAGQGLPKAAPTGYDLLGTMPLGTSRAVETARLRQSEESELAASIAAIDAVEHASVHLAVGETSVFIRDRAEPSASVFVQLAPGRALGEAQVRAIVHLVASSIAGLAPDRVSVVDQSGALLSGDPTSAGAGGEIQRQLAYQAGIEALYRQRVVMLLTPMLGQGNFSTQVSADVDFSQTEATHENYDRDGAVIRSEQGSNSSEAPPQPARGIPGALSNTVPPAATASSTPPEAGAPAASAGSPKSESFARNYEIGHGVSVTRAQVGQVRRLSVAVVVRDPGGPAKAQTAQVAALTDLVRSAIGFDARRGDVVTVASRPFAPITDTGNKWYEQPVVHDSGKAVAIVAGLAMLIFGLARPLLRRRTPVLEPLVPGAPLPPVIAPDGSIDYQAKLAATRSLVADDVSRATIVVRQMMQADQ